MDVIEKLFMYVVLYIYINVKYNSCIILSLRN